MKPARHLTPEDLKRQLNAGAESSEIRKEQGSELSSECHRYLDDFEATCRDLARLPIQDHLDLLTADREQDMFPSKEDTSHEPKPQKPPWYHGFYGGFALAALVVLSFLFGSGTLPLPFLTQTLSPEPKKESFSAGKPVSFLLETTGNEAVRLQFDLDSKGSNQSNEIAMIVLDPHEQTYLNLASSDNAPLDFLLLSDPGTYRLQFVMKATSGTFTARVVKRSEPTVADQKRFQAARLVAQTQVVRQTNSQKAREEAIDLYRQIAALYTEAEDFMTAGYNLNSMGYLQGINKNFKEAEYTHKLALLMRREISHIHGLAQSHNNLGTVYLDNNQLFAAEDQFEKAYMQALSIEDQYFMALAKNNQGGANEKLGDFGRALRLYQLALDIAKESDHEEAQAYALQNIGVIYNYLEETEKALEANQQALALWTNLEKTGAQVVVQNNLGFTYRLMNQRAMEFEAYNNALTLAKNIEDLEFRAFTYNNIGLYFFAEGNDSSAEEYFQSALEIRQGLPDHRLTAYTHFNLARVAARKGQDVEVQHHLDAALAMARDTGDRNLQPQVLHEQAELQWRQGQREEAFATFEKIVNQVEDQRLGMGESAQRAAYLASRMDSFQRYRDLLMEVHFQNPTGGWDIKAFDLNQRIRTRSLLEILKKENPTYWSGPDEGQRDRLAQIRQQRSQIEVTLAGLPADQDDTEINLLELELQRLADEMLVINQRFAKLDARDQPKGISRPLSLAEIRSRLSDKQTRFLELALGDQNSFGWLIEADQLTSIRLPDRETLEELTRDAHKFLYDYRGDADVIGKQRQTLSQLSRLTLEPFWSQIKDADRLAVVVDGPLQYIPFAALPQPGNEESDVIDLLEVVNQPSWSALEQLRQSRKPIGPIPVMALFADPIFEEDDDRISDEPGAYVAPDSIDPSALVMALRNPENLRRVSATGKEAGAIMALEGLVQVVGNIGGEATRSAVLESTAKDFDILHVATHGLLDDENPRNSGLFFASYDNQGKPIFDNRLNLEDIYEMKLNAQLVVLSACQTGLGKNLRGEGQMSLTRGFMVAGAPRVIASLWKVDDEGTAQLMTRFYNYLLRENQRPAEALRSAQLDMRATDKWKDPFYWAGFVFQGSWR